jgi:putative zinc finger protein
MNRCREARRVQDYLEGELAPERARAFEDHLEGCVDCLAEVASYRTLFASLDDSLDRIAFEDPGPALTERILDRVLPSRLRRRWVSAAGAIYGTLSAASTFLFVSWITRPEAHVWLAQRYSETSLRLVQSVLFAFQIITRSWFDLLEGWGFVERLVAVVSPVARALARPLADPTLGLITVAAMLASAVVLWWMRPRHQGAREGVRNVSLLGF